MRFNLFIINIFLANKRQVEWKEGKRFRKHKEVQLKNLIQSKLDLNVWKRIRNDKERCWVNKKRISGSL